MKKMRGLALVLALGVAASVTAMAQNRPTEDPYATMLISENHDVITVNGVALEGAKILEDEGIKMLPLRAICEALDFEVVWNGEARRIELVKLPVYITLTPDEDGYTFARTAPMLLGKAPLLKEGTTYVPINFIDEILKGSYDEEGGVNILWGVEEEKEETVTEETAAIDVYVKEVTEEGFLVEDFYRGDIRLAIGEDTVIEDAEGNAIAKEDVDVTMELSVELSDAMTMSIPPLANAVKITVKAETAKPVMSGEITEVIKEEDKVVQLVLGEDETVLNISEELVVTDSEGKEIEVEFAEGMTVRALTTGIATMSIPPQYPVTNIIVVE